MSVYVAPNRACAIKYINARTEGTVDLDYETAWEDALELAHLGQQCGVDVQYRTVEHISVESADALIRAYAERSLLFDSATSTVDST